MLLKSLSMVNMDLFVSVYSSTYLEATSPLQFNNLVFDITYWR